jgi:hypothetical protein
MSAIASLVLASIIKNIQTIVMTRQDFHAIPMVPFNRDVTPRLKKVAKLLKNPLPTHLEVAIVEFWENGKLVQWRINGNTRDEIWENHQGILIDPKNVPSDLLVTKYKVDDRKAAQKLYYSIDSSDSAENGSEKITGIFAKLGLSFTTQKLAKGLLTKVLEFASQNRSSNKGNRQLSDLNREKVIKDFEDELLLLDNVAIGKKNERFATLAMWCLSLMALKKYSHNEAQTAKVLTGLTRIKLNKADTTQDSWDGITHILQEWNKGKENGELKGVQGGSCGVTFPRQLDFLLFHFKNYMDDVKVKDKAWGRMTQKSNSKKRGNYFFNNWYTL